MAAMIARKPEDRAIIAIRTPDNICFVAEINEARYTLPPDYDGWQQVTIEGRAGKFARTPAEELAIAILRGDRQAALMAADLVQEQWAVEYQK